MSTSYTITETAPRELAGKIASDLRQFSLYYGQPPKSTIDDYLQEMEVLLARGLLGVYMFGFRRFGQWVLCYRYEVREGSEVAGRPGGIQPNVNVAGASYLNFLTYSERWSRLTEQQRNAIRATIRINRTTGDEPGYGAGYWTVERTYGAGGIELARQVFRP